MEVYRQMKASRIVTLVGLENIQALLMSKTGNAHRVALDITSPLEDRTTATLNAVLVRSRQGAPLHAHRAVRDLLKH